MINIGDKFGQWTVLESIVVYHELPNKRWRSHHSCVCSCGFIKNVSNGDLTSGKSTRCKDCYMKSRIKGFEEMIGRRFGKWVVLEKVFIEEKKRWRYRCSCDCGSEYILPMASLKLGISTRCLECGDHATIHNQSGHPLYDIWASMKARCLNPNYKNFKDYGGRGISICDRWLDINNFIEDMHPRPTLKHTVERINNSGNYEPLNCKWATYKEQCANRRYNNFNTLKIDQISSAIEIFKQSPDRLFKLLEIKKLCGFGVNTLKYWGNTKKIEMYHNPYSCKGQDLVVVLSNIVSNLNNRNASISE